ncbi:MAG: substrate-binding domain-containing protein [Burkholderiaceae bacterium]
MSEPISVISSMATRLVLSELAGRFSDATGLAVKIESVGGVDAARRVREGEVFDIVVLAANSIDKLIGENLLRADTRTGIAQSGVAIAVRAGTQHPDVSSEAALRAAVAAARSIGYSTGPSGAHLQSLFERWGLAEQVASRTVQAKPGVPVASLVAKGEVELGFQQLSELLSTEGIDVLGPLPPEVQTVTVFTAAVSSATRNADRARTLLAFLAATDADDIKQRHGMEAV